MASYSQPEYFYVDWMAATEVPPLPKAPIMPSNIVQVGDSLKLRAYFYYSGTVFWERKAVKDACEGDPNSSSPIQPAAKITYFLEDLEKGGTPIKIDGGTLTKLTSLDSQMQADGYTFWYFGSNDLVYRSEDTVEITTGAHGSGKSLELPTAAATEGTWQVTVVLSGGAGSGVSVFCSDMFVQVLK